MIEFLKISSMAIFDEVEIEFGQGLNCITGETGAGKSLVLGALMLLMGSKASQDLVRPGAQKASIEALFTISGGKWSYDGRYILRDPVVAMSMESWPPQPVLRKFRQT